MLLLATVALAGFVSALGAPHSIITGGGRIVNGTDAAPGQYPFIASLQYRGKHTCGSSVVNECYIVTASHCVDGREPVDLTVLAGTAVLGHGGVRHAAQLITMHPGYNPDAMYENDIALVKLSSPITFNDQAQPVALPNQLEPTKGGTLATVIGWGFPYTDGGVMEKLQHVNITVYDDEKCQSIHSLEVHDTNICAGVPEGGKGQCSGDSGGPLIAGGHQVGIVSWSVKPCTVAPYPGVYTEVAHYVDWIRENSKDAC
ncbi:hypothetical protein B7P43_G16109 [Cryptotermes secundus]|uniref:Peptidase S1 domain-containing protein n=1 Tax=Cryptotermes secundus TaxID=105785 RepID=A0A2J7QWX4_9NEOP|nr:trypsin-1 [Cryptotermes secundus]PNF33082.1 hypothetical protein B7P43_G16109 [Cryptotermes secundus]